MNEHSLFEPLSRREREILSLLCENLRDQEIAERLFLALPTIKWYNRQLFNKLGVENRREAIKRAKTSGLLAQNGAAGSAPAKHNLPSQLTPFVGRSRELAEIDGWLAHPHTRLLTILAPGGMGKTRLALEAAERGLSRYADGVFFVPLAALTSTDHIVPALAEALGLQFAPDGRTPQQQLFDFLRRKHLLLVVDNFEHLVEAAPLISDLLTAAPKVTALVTSRERLNLNGEVVYPLAGLHYPDTDSDEEPLRFGAVELFIECALRANPRFVTHDSAVIGQLCRRVQGMPLAIELAAAWSGTLSMAEIDMEIKRSADFLQTSMSNVPERQRSVRAVFEAAWARLDDDAQRVFRRMSVFRGGCTREAAQAVTGASIQTLAALVDKALLWRDPQSGRYDIHELLRQYAEGELDAEGEAEATRQAHQEYYANFSAIWGDAMLRDKHLEALEMLDADSENVWLALDRATRRGIAAEIEPFTDLWMYYDVRSRWKEVERVFGYACEMLEPHESVALAKLYAGRSIIFAEFRQFQEALATGKQAFEIIERLNDRRVLPMTMSAYAMALYMTGDKEKASNFYQDTIILAEALDQPVWIARAWHHLSNHSRLEGRLDEAKARKTASYQIYRKLNNFWGMSYTLLSLGYLALSIGDFDEGYIQFKLALETAERANYQMAIRDAALALSATLKAKGELVTARSYAEMGLSTSHLLGLTDTVLMRNLFLLTDIAILRQEAEEARRYLIEIITLLEKQYIQEVSWIYCFFVTGAYFSLQRDFLRAAILISACDRLDPERKMSTRKGIEEIDNVVTRCREALSPEEFEAAWARGQAMTNEEAIALVAEALR
jgi:predicted ATPase/DNA-binding CsgD family transcriptional regulator